MHLRVFGSTQVMRIGRIRSHKSQPGDGPVLFPPSPSAPHLMMIVRGNHR
jgi:hypothetical protein